MEEKGAQEMTEFKVGDTVVATGVAWDDFKWKLGKVVALQDDRPDRPLVAFGQGGFSWPAWGECAVELVEAANVAQEETNEASDAINPAHYQGFSNGAQVVDITEHLSFSAGSAIKYLARAGKKDPAKHVEDLEKAAWFVQREIQRVKAGN